MNSSDLGREVSGSAVLKTLLLTDLVSSTKLVEDLGDRRAFELFGHHDRVARSLLEVNNGREIDKTDGFLLLFDRPVDAVRYALAYHRALADLSARVGVDLAARAGIHLGEVYMRENPPEEVARGAKPVEVEGLAKPAAARVMSLATGRQTLLTRGAFDVARRAARDSEISALDLAWLDHGLYVFKGIEEPVAVFEVGEVGFASLEPPPDSTKVRRVADVADKATGRLEGGAAQVVVGSRLGRFEIVEAIGAGGMGEVYRARDVELARDVAIKVLPEELAGDCGRLARFRREARAIARVSHANLLEVFDFTGDGEIAFLVTELLEGENLRGHLRGKTLPWREAAEIGLAVAEGLAAAHEQGVIHRDLKPENIFCTSGGGVKVLDFGLARIEEVLDTGAATGSVEAIETADGAVLGTVGYMAPEQVRGEAADARSDVFALGCVLYELVAGERPFKGRTQAESLAAILEREPIGLRSAGAELPAEMDALIASCLEKAPTDRVQTAREVASALRAVLAESEARVLAIGPDRRRPVRLWAAVSAVLVAVAVVIWQWTTRQVPPPVAETNERVVVAMFSNHSGDPELDVLSVMAADTISQALAQTGVAEIVPGSVAIGAFYGVMARLAAEPGLDPLQNLADATQARLVVSGSIYLMDQRLQMQAQITDVEESRVIVALEPVVGEPGDAVAVLDEVRQRIVGAVAEHNSTVADFTLVSRPPKIEAYRELVAGVEVFGQDYDRAISHFERALELDPRYTAPTGWIIATLGNQGRFAEAYEVVEEAEGFRGRLTSFEALQLDADRASLEGRTLANLEARREIVALSPVSATDTYLLAGAALDVNRPQEALDAITEFPRSSAMGTHVDFFWNQAHADALHLLGRYEEELEVGRRSVEEFPDVPRMRVILGRSLAALNRQTAMEVVVDELMAAAVRGGPSADLGSVGEALVTLAAELYVHGHGEQAAHCAERALRWYGELPVRSNKTIEVLLGRARALYLADRWQECAVTLDSALAQLPVDLQGPYTVIPLGWRGVVAARLGHREQALEIAEQLRSADRPFLRGEHFYQRARIAAQLGAIEEAVGLLRTAFAQGREYGREVHADSALGPLCENHEFQELMRPKG